MARPYFEASKCAGPQKSQNITSINKRRQAELAVHIPIVVWCRPVFKAFSTSAQDPRVFEPGFRTFGMATRTLGLAIPYSYRTAKRREIRQGGQTAAVECSRICQKTKGLQICRRSVLRILGRYPYESEDRPGIVHSQCGGSLESGNWKLWTPESPESCGRKQEAGIHSSRGTRHTSPCNGIPLVLFSAHPDPSLKPPRWARRYAERGRA